MELHVQEEHCVENIDESEGHGREPHLQVKGVGLAEVRVQEAPEEKAVGFADAHAQKPVAQGTNNLAEQAVEERSEDEP